jgi:hypothetical protein
MILGDIIDRLQDDGEATELILNTGSLRLMTAMQRQAQAEGVGLAAYARAAVQRYAANASDEEWITLMGQIGQSTDPGSTCLRRAFEFALRD